MQIQISQSIFYNLDVVISVGYRVKSLEGTRFRQWATKTLREHMIQGYTINRHGIKSNHGTFIKAIEDVKALLPSGSKIETSDILELISMFDDAWLSLDAYDKDQLSTQGTTKRKVTLT